MVSSTAQAQINRLQDTINALDTQKGRLQELSYSVSKLNSAGEKVWAGNVHDEYESAVNSVGSDLDDSINDIIAAQTSYNRMIEALRYS